MREVVLFIAMSLDGYIADCNGGVGWLDGQGKQEENLDSYPAFAESVDTVLMGWNTYRQVVTELSPSEWIYGDFTAYVFTHRQRESAEKIRFTHRDPAELIRELKAQEGKDIWICGGADLIRQLRRSDLIDRYIVSIIPTILGKGIRLFDEAETERKLSLVRVRNGNGIVELSYVRR